jgi:hypothetical protein
MLCNDFLIDSLACPLRPDVMGSIFYVQTQKLLSNN